MKNSLSKIAATFAFLLFSGPIFAMPGGDHMMPKMSAKNMQRLAVCKAMDPAMAMKKKRCAKLMKQEEMSMQDHKM
jgi:hypothetical protein